MVLSRAVRDPARPETLCMYGTSMRENREFSWSRVSLIGGVPPRECYGCTDMGSRITS